MHPQTYASLAVEVSKHLSDGAVAAHPLIVLHAQ
jgi:hypothetical protein